MGHLIVVWLAVAVIPAVSPRHAPSPSTAPPPSCACPTDTTIELLHDAVFHLDRGDDDARVREDLREARARTERDAAGASWARGFVERVGAALGRDDGTRQYEAEVIRRDLHESPCLTEEMHVRFHRSLPAVHHAPAGSPRRRP